MQCLHMVTHVLVILTDNNIQRNLWKAVHIIRIRCPYRNGVPLRYHSDTVVVQTIGATQGKYI